MKRATAVSAAVPVLPIPVLEVIAKEPLHRALPPLVPAPGQHQGQQHRFPRNSCGTVAPPPPSLRMFPSGASIIGTLTPALSVFDSKCLRIPPLTAAYVPMQQAVPLPLMPMNVMPVLPTAVPAFTTSNFICPPPLRLHLPSLSSGQVMSSFQTATSGLAASNSVQPPPLRFNWQNADGHSSVPFATLSGTSSLQTVRPPLSTSSLVRPPPQPPPLRFNWQNADGHSSVPFATLSGTSSLQTVRPPLSTSSLIRPPPLRLQCSNTTLPASNHFSLSSTRPYSISQSACLPQSCVSVRLISAAQSQNSTSARHSQVSISVQTQQTSAAVCIGDSVIDVDDDSHSRLMDKRVSAVAMSSSVDSCRAVPSSTTTRTVHVVDVDDDGCSELTDRDKRDGAAEKSTGAQSSPVVTGTEVVNSTFTTSKSGTVNGRSSRLTLLEVNNHFQQWHAGYDCLRHIFRYLDVCTRLRAAQVCRCWRRLAAEQRLVNSVTFCYRFGACLVQFLLLTVNGLTTSSRISLPRLKYKVEATFSAFK